MNNIIELVDDSDVDGIVDGGNNSPVDRSIMGN